MSNQISPGFPLFSAFLIGITAAVIAVATLLRRSALSVELARAS